MQHAVPLCTLPVGLEFPEQLRKRVHYDPARRTLAFDGFMTKCRFDELTHLSTDPEYRRALEELFVLSSEEVLPPSSARGLWVGLAAAAAAVLALSLTLWAIWKWPVAGKGAGAHPPVNQSAGR